MVNWFKKRKWTLLYTLFTVVFGMLGVALDFLICFAVYHLGYYSFEFSLLPTSFFEWVILIFLAAVFALALPGATFGQLGWYSKLTAERERLNEEQKRLNEERERLNKEQEMQYTKEKSGYKKPILIVGIVLLALLITSIFFIKPISINNNIAEIANKKGEKYGVTDITSKSASFNNEISSIQLYSDQFHSLSDEYKFKFMISLGTDEEMISMLSDERQASENPLMGSGLIIHSADAQYNIAMDNEDDTICIKAGNVCYEATGIEEHGFYRPFTNEYGTKNTPCSVPGCYNKIARSGDTNCCKDHSKKCGNCYRYIDRDALFCMSCLKSALS